MKRILLTQGKVTQVDDEDFERLNQFKWYAQGHRPNLYAVRKTAPRSPFIRMYNIILPPPCGMFVDHIDGNTLNNLKSNLRIVTWRQNGQNKHILKTSKYCGVYWDSARKKWHAQISMNGKCKMLGRFTNEIDAHLAYQNALSLVIN